MAKDRRVEVLFDEKDYERLERAALARKESVGAVIREAVAKYVVTPDEERRRKAFEWFQQDHDGPVGSPEEIKAAIVRSMTEGVEKSVEAD